MALPEIDFTTCVCVLRVRQQVSRGVIAQGVGTVDDFCQLGVVDFWANLACSLDNRSLPAVYSAAMSTADLVGDLGKALESRLDETMTL